MIQGIPMKVVAIIPARMAATRFPGKPLAKICGIPMIGHCLLRSQMAKSLDEVYVATCDREIYDYVLSIGGKAVMTANSHERATDRTAEALRKIEQLSGKRFDCVAMVQGDEPLVHPDMIDRGIGPFVDFPSIKVVNLMTPISTIDRFESPNDVKVVVNLRSEALYFSREPIPSRKKFSGDLPMLRQLGLIFFRRDFLFEYSEMKPTPLEIIESVDMNRVLEHGEKIKMVRIDFQSLGVDVPEDLDRAARMFDDDKLLGLYRARLIN